MKKLLILTTFLMMSLSSIASDTTQSGDSSEAIDNTHGQASTTPNLAADCDGERTEGDANVPAVGTPTKNVEGQIE